MTTKTKDEQIKEAFNWLNLASFDPNQGVWVIVPKNMNIFREKVKKALDTAQKRGRDEVGKTREKVHCLYCNGKMECEGI